MKYILKTVWILLAITYTAVAADQPMLAPTPYAKAKEYIGKGKPVLFEVGAESCYSCQIMGKTLYKIKKENPTLNIYFINIQKEREVATPLKIMVIPTQIIYDQNGKEVYRHIGVLKEDEVSKLLATYGFDT